MLNWVAHDHIPEALCAWGVRGEYSVRQVGMEWVLSAVGHDGLQMWVSPLGGRTFSTLDAALARAEELDQMPAEAEISGC